MSSALSKRFNASPVFFNRDQMAREAAALDLTLDENLKALYYDTEKYDGYLRDRDVFDAGITIEDNLALLVDYACSKAGIHALTKSLALYLGEKGIRVNCVVPGPVWTPNIPGTMPRAEIEKFGHEVALKRPGQPEELAPAYVLLASQDGSFMTGALVHVTGGKLSSDE